MDNLIKDMDFPRSLNGNIWEKYLERPLTIVEQQMLNNVKSEKNINDVLEKIYNIGLSKGIFISHLTELYGNCLFESLIELGIGNSVKSLRESLSYLMYIFRDYKSFFETQEETIEELFVFSNEIEYVYCSKETTYYKFTYDVMCQDMSNDNSWTRLPTQLFLMIISRLYKIEIIIIHDSNYETIINTNKNAIRTIYLGLLGEYHYVPLKKIEKKEDLIFHKYNKLKKMFYLWAIKEWNYKQNTNDSTTLDNNKNDSTISFN
jgi:hypothetical protein